MFSKVNVIALLGFIGRFQQHLCPITLTVQQTHGTWVNQPSYALGLKTVWKEEPLLHMISKGVLFVLLGVLRRFQNRICQITRTVHILMRPG